jgi:hypothetical protein
MGLINRWVFYNIVEIRLILKTRSELKRRRFRNKEILHAKQNVSVIFGPTRGILNNVVILNTTLNYYDFHVIGATWMLAATLEELQKSVP